MSVFVDGVEVTEAMVVRALGDILGIDRTLPGDRPDHEKEWAFPGPRGEPDGPIDMTVRGAGRSAGGTEWAGKDRIYYGIWRDTGYIPRVWAWACYPKDQWSEDEARAYHQAELAKLVAAGYDL